MEVGVSGSVLFFFCLSLVCGRSAKGLNKKGERQGKGIGRRALGELLEVIEFDS